MPWFLAWAAGRMVISLTEIGKREGSRDFVGRMVSLFWTCWFWDAHGKSNRCCLAGRHIQNHDYDCASQNRTCAIKHEGAGAPTLTQWIDREESNEEIKNEWARSMKSTKKAIHWGQKFCGLDCLRVHRMDLSLPGHWVSSVFQLFCM